MQRFDRDRCGRGPITRESGEPASPCLFSRMPNGLAVFGTSGPIMSIVCDATQDRPDWP
jgi:hypothetical protein